MKHVASVIGLVMGVTGCTGAVIGGDKPGDGGGGSTSSGGENYSEAGAGSGNVQENSGGKNAGGNTAGNSGGNAGVNSGGSTAPSSGGYSGGSGGGNTAGTAGGNTAGTAGGDTAGQGGAPPAYEPTSSCASTVDAWIAFDSDAADFNRDLYLVRPDGSRLTRLTTDASLDKEPYFSPRGDLLSFTSDRSGTLQIYVMDLGSRTVTQVTHRAEGADQSSFSANGELLAFHSGSSVFTIKLDGSDEKLIADSGINTFNGYFSPRFIDNDQLVFDRNNEIDAINLDQTNFRNIVGNTTTTIVAPTVSPQSNEIAYAAWCYTDTSLSIWTAAASVSAQVCTGRRVTPVHDPLTNSRPSWGPGSTFAYERVDLSTSIGRITLNNRAAGSIPCSLTAPTQDSRNPNWSPEGLEL